jgi:hypothetical protein
MAGPTGLEPATSYVTGRRSNQLSYDPKLAGLANRLDWQYIIRIISSTNTVPALENTE